MVVVGDDGVVMDYLVDGVGGDVGDVVYGFEVV